MAHGGAGIFCTVVKTYASTQRPSQGPEDDRRYLPDDGYQASAAHGVPVHAPAFADIHCAYPKRDDQAELTRVTPKWFTRLLGCPYYVGLTARNSLPDELKKSSGSLPVWRANYGVLSVKCNI